MLLRAGLRAAGATAIDPSTLTPQQVEHFMQGGARAVVADALTVNRLGYTIETQGHGRYRRARYVPLTVACQGCGTPLQVGVGSTQRYCVPCKQQRASPRTLTDYQCELCGRSYRPDSVRQRFCSRSCSGKHNGAQPDHS